MFVSYCISYNHPQPFISILRECLVCACFYSLIHTCLSCQGQYCFKRWQRESKLKEQSSCIQIYQSIEKGNS